MARLNDKQRAIAEGLACGLSEQEAVAAAGYKSKGNAACNQVARMMRNDEFSAYLAGLRKDSRSESVLTAHEVKEGLSRLLASAEANEDYSGYTQLANRLAKMDGHDEPERHKMEFEITIGGDGNPED